MHGSRIWVQLFYQDLFELLQELSKHSLQNMTFCTFFLVLLFKPLYDSVIYLFSKDTYVCTKKVGNALYKGDELFCEVKILNILLKVKLHCARISEKWPIPTYPFVVNINEPNLLKAAIINKTSTVLIFLILYSKSFQIIYPSEMCW